MHILLLGWEFPPNSVGGLGTHTYGLARALSRIGISVTLFLPAGKYEKVPGVELVNIPVGAKYGVYSLTHGSERVYDNISETVNAYTREAARNAIGRDFDIIQANDWITAEAGIEIRRLTGKPLVLVMHSLEYDRTAGMPGKDIEERERRAVNSADKVIAVSRRLKEEIIKFYNCNPEKISVIHNAVDMDRLKKLDTGQRKKLVLYVGRLSPQKGLYNLLQAFKIVASNDKEVKLGIAGEGPEMLKLIDLSITLGIKDRVIFFGRVSEDEKDYLYSVAKVFVMPSVSEPFGITALEAVAYNTPVVVSKQSGVSETLSNVFKVDFWDTNQMADIILGILNYPMLDEIITRQANGELSKITWKERAKKFVDLYKSMSAG